MQQQKEHEQWSSQWLFIMATIGSSVGLANIWRFPFTAGENGGGAFVLIYLAAVFVLATPLLMGELMLGRRGQACPPVGLRAIAKEANASEYWSWLGYLGVATALTILSYYCMIGGETIIYAVKNISGQFVNIDVEGSLAISAEFNANLPMVIFGHTLFIGVMGWVSSRGISGGLEIAVKYLMPSLFIILIAMVIYAAVTGSFAQSLSYLFQPDFSKINIEVIVAAFGQAFFSVGAGATILMAYGSYMHRDDSIINSSLIVAGADSLVALLSGLAIFPIVFAFGLNPGAGPGLVFETVPLAFGHMPGGQFVGTLFFILLAFAAITSAISLLEAPVAWLQSKDGWSRKKAAWTGATLVWLLGMLPVLSLNNLADFYPFGFIGVERNFFDFFDYLSNNLMLPLGGLLLAIFIGWVLPNKISQEELSVLAEHHWFKLWMFMLRYVITTILVVVFINLILAW
ncbi:sodium-dependent transporter [Gammaproteobacteria bacterium]|jgi:neurotransmitter:Na+ symporter, NSS family|nr:sodium-dependent transporter [Gammaproteobacteria bacterium]